MGTFLLPRHALRHLRSYCEEGEGGLQLSRLPLRHVTLQQANPVF